jgi:hypothetical protein
MCDVHHLVDAIMQEYNNVVGPLPPVSLESPAG